MSMTIEQIRRRIGDKPKHEIDRADGDGQNKTFSLRFSNIANLKVTKDGSTVNASSYTLDASNGTVTFSTSPALDSKLVFDYTYSAYTDDELTTYQTNYGDNGAIEEVLRELLADSARLYDYSEGATDAKLSQVYKQLSDLLDRYLAEDAANGGGDGGVDGGVNSVSVGRRTSTLFEDEPRHSYDLSREDI